GGQRAERAWHGTRPRAETNDDVVGVPEGALGPVGSARFHHHGSVDQGRLGHLLPAFCHAFGHASGVFSWLHTQPRRFVDGADGTPTDGRLRWFSAGAAALCAAGSGYEVHGRVSENSDAVGGKAGVIAAA